MAVATTAAIAGRGPRIGGEEPGDDGGQDGAKGDDRVDAQGAQPVSLDPFEPKPQRGQRSA